MTIENFKQTPVNASTKVLYAGKTYMLLGLNWLSGTIRLKGHTENVNADFSECEFLKNKE